MPCHKNSLGFILGIFPPTIFIYFVEDINSTNGFVSLIVLLHVCSLLAIYMHMELEKTLNSFLLGVFLLAVTCLLSKRQVPSDQLQSPILLKNPP